MAESNGPMPNISEPDAAVIPLLPWTVVVARGTLLRENERDHIGCEELSARLRLPVVAYLSSCGDPPQNSGIGEQTLKDVNHVEQARDALADMRELFATPPVGITDAASLRAWAKAQLGGLRLLLDEADAALADEKEGNPSDAARSLAVACAEYADTFFACESTENDDGTPLIKGWFSEE